MFISKCVYFEVCICTGCRSEWPRGLRRGSAAARLLGLWVRIPPRAWMPVSCECCVLSGRGLCDGLVTRPEESYRGWCVRVWSWSLEKKMRRPRPPRSCWAIGKKFVLDGSVGNTFSARPRVLIKTKEEVGGWRTLQPALVLRPFLLRLFALTPLASLYRFLICDLFFGLTPFGWLLR
jgi:hypothetical protein